MDDYFRSDYDTTAPPPKRDNLFAWTIFILLLTGFALACWLGSFYIFGHPEKPQSYRILQKLNKIEPPRRFALTEAPAGEFLTAQKLYDRYNSFSRLQLQKENDELLRNYINNYQATKKLVPYVVGRFNILDSYELKPTDLFGSGVVALAQAAEFPQVLIEHVYTSDPVNVPLLSKMLQTGLDVKLEKTLDLAAIVHIDRLFNGSLQFTVVPLLYGSYALKQGTGTFNLEPPPSLNLESGAPIVRTDRMQAALKTYADHRRKSAPGASTALLRPPTGATAAAKTSSAAELVRVESSPEPGEPAQTPAAVPAATAAVAVAVAAPTPRIAAATPAPVEVASPPVARAVPSPTPVTLAMASPRPAPVGTPIDVQPAIPVTTTPVPAPAPAAPVPTPPAVTPDGVPLQPFIASAPAPTMANTGATWRTFEPGQMPRGRVIEPQEAAPLAERGVSGERLYLRGQFVVTASGENRAVLRPQGGFGSLIRPGAGATRVMVEYPAGMAPPAEGATFSRDETRPFMVTDVRRGADGQINVYVREVMADQP